jgi:phosphate transport system protein
MSKHLERQIDALKEKILFVGACVEEAIAKAVASVVNRDRPLATQVIEADDEIDRLEVDVEEECLKTLALYQPVALDLRFVIACLKINNDLERMGDLATNIAKRAVFLTECEPTEFTSDIRAMAVMAQAMVKNSLDALIRSDQGLAQRIREEDDEVDAMRKTLEGKIRRELQASPHRTECWLKLISVVKHIERLADMATNVAEEVIYMVEGEIVRHKERE